MLYNLMHRGSDTKDPTEVILITKSALLKWLLIHLRKRRKKPLKVAEGTEYGRGGYQFDILAIIAARNEQETKNITQLIDFEYKI
jgi:type I restriction enzyme R subunit